MIVCSCNVISSSAVQQTIARCNGACSTSDVYGSLGCQPVCGRCARTIADMIRANAVQSHSQNAGRDALCVDDTLAEMACA